VRSTEANRDRWRRKQHALDRERERETAAVTMDGEDADEVLPASRVDREGDLVDDRGDGKRLFEFTSKFSYYNIVDIS
jgi:hypothetical protein